DIEWVTFTDPDDFLDRDYFYEVDRFLRKEEGEDIIAIKTTPFIDHIKDKPKGKIKNKISIDSFIDLDLNLYFTSLIFSLKLFSKNNNFKEDIKNDLYEAFFMENICSNNQNKFICFVKNANIFKSNAPKNDDSLHDLHKVLKKYIDFYYKKHSLVSKFLQKELLKKLEIFVQTIENNKEITSQEQQELLSFLKRSFDLINDNQIIFNFNYTKRYYKILFLECFKKVYYYPYEIYRESLHDGLKISYFSANKDSVESIFFHNKEIFAYKEEIYELSLLEQVFYKKVLYLNIGTSNRTKFKVNGKKCTIIKNSPFEINKKLIYSYSNKRLDLDLEYITQKACKAKNQAFLDLALKRYDFLYKKTKNYELLEGYCSCLRNVYLYDIALSLLSNLSENQKTEALKLEEIKCLIGMKLYNKSLKMLLKLEKEGSKNEKILYLKLRIYCILEELEKAQQLLIKIKMLPKTIETAKLTTQINKNEEFHIIFNADEKYFKYVAVMIYNIISKIDKNKKFSDFLNLSEKSIQNEKFVFHILTDIASKESLEKFDKLQKELNFIFKCEILIHEVDESDFKNCPKWQNHENHLCYFKIKLGDFIPEYIDKCIFLDADMLVLSDIREIFAINLEDKVAASTPDCSNSLINRKLKSVNQDKAKLTLSYQDLYFNVGFMLINLKKWREINVKSRALNFLKCYIPRVPEQDTLNYALSGEIIRLSPKYNFFIAHFLDEKCHWKSSFKDEVRDYIYDYTREEYEEALKDIKIIHFTYGVPKPWESIYKDIAVNFKLKFYPFYKEWWQNALNVPIFKDELKRQKENNENGLKIYSIELSKRLNIIEQRLNYTETLLGLENNNAFSALKNQKSYHTGNIMVKNKSNILKLVFILFSELKKEKLREKYLKILAKKNYSEISTHFYEDHEKAQIELKKHLSYRLGEAFYKNKLSFIFKIKSIYKEFKNLNK
ncbi:hypothetical protein DMB92_01865, partial [Campylobacter sp. MIT 99-7217]|uniref:glycosyltransferase family 8 protein n=1 Tax=Campylobacter sp. MIT 99-7217 TaxID=535091 RepID=UPI001157D705